MQKIQGNTDDVLSRIELRDDEKAKRYLQLQNRYLAFKEQSTSRTRPGEINSAVPELPSTVLPTPLNPFNATPDLNQAAILQKLEKESSTPPPPLNPAFLTPPAAVETPTLCHGARQQEIPEQRGSQVYDNASIFTQICAFARQL